MINSFSFTKTKKKQRNLEAQCTLSQSMPKYSDQVFPLREKRTFASCGGALSLSQFQSACGFCVAQLGMWDSKGNSGSLMKWSQPQNLSNFITD